MGGSAKIIGRNVTYKAPSAQVFLSGGGSLLALNSVLVSDAFRIQSTIPADLAVGSYDIVVKNPDGQLGQKTGALTIVEKKAGGCACSLGAGQSQMRSAAPATFALLFLLFVAIRIRRRPRQIERILSC